MAPSWESNADFQAFCGARDNVFSGWCWASAVCTFPRRCNCQKMTKKSSSSRVLRDPGPAPRRQMSHKGFQWEEK